MIFLWFSYDFPMVSHYFPMVFLWFSYGFPWFSYGFPMIFVWFPMIFLWVSYDFPMVSLDFPMVFLWFSYGFPLLSYGFPMIFLWFPMIFLWFLWFLYIPFLLGLRLSTSAELGVPRYPSTWLWWWSLQRAPPGLAETINGRGKVGGVEVEVSYSAGLGFLVIVAIVTIFRWYGGAPKNGGSLKLMISNGKADYNGWFGGTHFRKPPSWGLNHEKSLEHGYFMGFYLQNMRRLLFSLSDDSKGCDSLWI